MQFYLLDEFNWISRSDLKLIASLASNTFSALGFIFILFQWYVYIDYIFRYSFKILTEVQSSGDFSTYN